MAEVDSSDIGLLVATGPSLNEIPTNFLASYTSFAPNGIYYLKEFVPDFYFCSTATLGNTFTGYGGYWRLSGPPDRELHQNSFMEVLLLPINAN